MSRRNRRRAALRKKPKQRATHIKQGGWTPFKLDEELSARMRTPCYVNNHYSVQTIELPNGITYLSIKRLKRSFLCYLRPSIRPWNRPFGPGMARLATS